MTLFVLFITLVAIGILALWAGPFWKKVPDPGIVFPYKICNLCRNPALQSKEEESRGVCDDCFTFGDGPQKTVVTKSKLVEPDERLVEL